MTENTSAAEEHERELKALLDSLGRATGQQERLLDKERRQRTRLRMEKIAEEVEHPFEGLDQRTLTETLSRELEQQREQERRLHQIRDVSEWRSRLEDQLRQELELHCSGDQERQLLEELRAQCERRKENFEQIDFLSLPATRNQLTDILQHQRRLESLLFHLVELHLKNTR